MTLITDSPLNNLLLKFEGCELSIKFKAIIHTLLEWLTQLLYIVFISISIRIYSFANSVLEISEKIVSVSKKE